MGEAVCSACGRRFPVRFTYQTEATPDGTIRHFCSIGCRMPELEATRTDMPARMETCAACERRFRLRYAFQIITIDQVRRLVCSQACRGRLVSEDAPPGRRTTRVIAVLNQKGGTGKTTTSVSVAAGLARQGRRTLLVDLDAQGNVGVSFGITAPRNLYHVLVEDLPPSEAVVAVRRDLDVLCCDQAMAAAELELVDQPDRARVLARRMRPLVESGRYDFMIIDCGPSLSLLNQNALTLAREVLIPVSCDYLALVGVKQILKTIRHVNDNLLHPVDVLGVVPTFFDVRNKISRQAVEALESYFKERMLPPIRVNARLKEAPSHDKTIFEYAPDSRGAKDYQSVVDRILEAEEAVVAMPVAQAMTEAI